MASISNAHVMRHLVLAPGVVEHFREDLMGKIGVALAAAAGGPPGEHPSREGAIGVRIEPELSGGQPPWISRTFDTSWAT
jgi:hypothetical protein